ncbi:hypothetical protein ACP70R_011895 [Stipagrostis hirtigluma subsp. patula]
MVSSGHQGAATRKHLRVLLPFTCDSLRIPDELAEEIGGGEALVVGPSAKVWRVEVGQDLDGAFLGRGWPEFTDACGVDAGWLLVLRHRGQGVLTVKAFDTSFCLRELGTPPAAEATTSSKDASRRPQFISRLRPDSMEKMLIPSKFVQQCIPKLHMSNHRAIVLGPLGKVYPIGLEMNQLDVFFAGGWSQFMAFHGITKANFLLLRYEGNMVFTVKVFEPDGFQRESKPKDIVVQQKLLDNEERQETPSGSTGKRRSKNDWPSSEGQMTSLNKASLRRATFYQIGPPSWIKKQINASTLETKLALSNTFCEVIGLREPCTIILKTSMDSTKSWQVCGFPGKNGSYMLVEGWRRFCQENSLKQGDTCTFNVVETTLWHVTITHYKEKINQLCNNMSTKFFFASGLLQGDWTPRTLHDHAQDLNEQQHLLAGACYAVQELQSNVWVGLEEVLL